MLFQQLLSLRFCAFAVLSWFLAYLVLGIAMLVFPSTAVYRDGMIIASLFTLASFVHAAAASMYLYKVTKKYQRPLGYTILSSIFAMVAGLVLYPVRWHNGLTTDSLQLRSVAQTTIPLPAVAVMSIPWRSDFANITTDNPPKCYIADWAGGFNDDESLCSTIPSEEVLGHHNCSCGDMWSPPEQGLADDYYDHIPYRVLQPGPNLMINTTLATFVLQLSSTFNSSRTPAGYPIQGPALTVLLYDRNISLVDAFKNGYGTRTIIDAHGTTSLSITPEYHIGFDHDPYYVYTSAGAGSISNLNMVCDVAQPDQYTGPCYFGLDIRFISMNRLEVIKQKELSPPDVFVEFGAYYALFQFVAWLVAGMATSAT